MSRKTLLIAIGAVVGVVVLWWFLLWSPRQAKVAEARERAEAAETRQADLELRVARLKDLEEDQALKQSQLEELRVAIPDQPNLAQFILDANEAANKAGIEFLTISPQPPTAESAIGGAAPVNLSITVAGGYFQVLDYLNRLDDLRRIVVVDSLNVTPGGTGAQSTKLSVSITARMFVNAATVAPSTGSAGTDQTAQTAGATPTTAPAAAIPGGP